MSPFPLQLFGNKLLMDNSTLGAINTCNRSAAYKYLLHRQLNKPRAALFFGGAIHKALEVRDLHREVFCTRETEEEMINALVQYYEGVDFGSDYRNLNYAINTIEKYNTVHRFDQEVAIEIGTPPRPAVELPFALPVGTIPIGREMTISDPDIDNGTPHKQHVKTIEIIFTGKVDRVCEYQGGLYIFDHKTTSMGGPTFFSEFFTSLQFRGYKWAIQNILGRRIDGVIINGLVCRPPLKTGAVNYTFDRQAIPLDDSMIVEWQTSFMQTTQQWLDRVGAQEEHTDPSQAFPLNTGSCFAKYGQCEYFDVCQLPVTHRPGMIMSPLYEDHSWSPLEDSAKPKQPKPMPDLDSLFT